MAIVIASNVLHFGEDTVIAAADTVPAKDSSAANPTVAARDVSELLGRVADYGCRVVVFLDGVHQLPEKSFDNTIKPWVRDLQRNRRVITFVASKEGPSLAGDARSRACSTLGAANAFLAAGPGAYTLEAFQRQLRKEVLDLSERGQEAGAFIPIEVDPKTLFAQP